MLAKTNKPPFMMFLKFNFISVIIIVLFFKRPNHFLPANKLIHSLTSDLLFRLLKLWLLKIQIV